jgi:hypothetical protein
MGVHGFRRVRKIPRSDCYLRVCLSVRTEEHGSHWTDFHGILITFSAVALPTPTTSSAP